MEWKNAARILNGSRLISNGQAYVRWERSRAHGGATAYVTAQGRVYEGGFGNDFASLSSENGEPRWEATASSKSAVEPSATPQGTVFVSRGNAIEAFDDRGVRKWRNDDLTKSLALATSAGLDGKCYAVDKIRLYALDGDDGHVVWKYSDNSAYDDQPPVVGPDNRLYFVTSHDALVALDATDGHEIWKFDGFEKRKRPLFPDICTRPAVGPDGSVYFGANDGKLHALDKNGHEKWALELGGTPARDAAPDVDGEGNVYMAAGADRDRLLCVSANKEVKFDVSLGPIEKLAAAPRGGAAVVTGESVLALDAAGAKQWQFEPGDRPTKPVFGPHGEVLVGSDRTLYAVQSVLAEGAGGEKAGPSAAPAIVRNHDHLIIGGVRIPRRLD
jgi:outer membrane protein assembly factor BamB